MTDDEYGIYLKRKAQDDEAWGKFAVGLALLLVGGPIVGFVLILTFW